MTRRAVSLVHRIPATTELYHPGRLLRLQTKMMGYISATNLVMRNVHVLNEFMQDVQEFIHEPANLTASLESENSVTLAARIASNMPPSPHTPYRQGSPGLALQQPPPTTNATHTQRGPRQRPVTGTGRHAYRRYNPAPVQILPRKCTVAAGAGIKHALPGV